MGMDLTANRPGSVEEPSLHYNVWDWKDLARAMFELGLDMREIRFHNGGDVVSENTAKGWVAVLDAVESRDDRARSKRGEPPRTDGCRHPSIAGVDARTFSAVRTFVDWAARAGGFAQW